MLLIFNLIKYFIFYLLEFFLFSIIYIYLIVPYFSYEGFYIEISEGKVILSIIFLLFLALIIEKKDKFSISLINALIGFSIIPMLVLFSFQNLSTEYILYVVSSITLIIIICRIKFNLKSIAIALGLKYIFIVTIVIALSVLIYLFFINYKYFNLDIEKVYEYRGLITENTPILIEYVYNSIFKGILLLLLLYYLFYLKSKFKKFILTLFFIIFYILIFGITSHKYFLFIVPAIVVLYLMANLVKDWSLFFIKNILIFLIFIIFFINIAQDSQLYLLIVSLFIKRLFFDPAMLNFAYFEFFKTHNFVYFTDSYFLPFKYILGYPYDIDISHLIGREIFGKQQLGANTGWLGSGYAQLGFLGMLIYAFIISLILKYLDHISQYLSKGFIILSFMPYIITLFLSADLKTTFLTHGLMGYIILMHIFAYNQKKRGMKFVYKKKSMSYFNSSSFI